MKLSHLFAIILSFLISLSGLKAQSISDQQTNIKWSEPYNEPPNSFLSKIIHTDREGFYALRIQSEGLAAGKADVFIEYYSKDGMKLRRSRSLELKYKNKVRDFEDVVKLRGDNMYFLTSFNNQAKKKNYLFHQKISTKTLKPGVKLTKIAEVDSKNKYKEGGFRSHVSKDTSKILIYSMLPKNKKQPERFFLQVFDESFTQLWSKEVTLPFDDDKFSIEEYQIDNEGNVYILGVVYEDQSRFRRSGKPTYQYMLLTYRDKGEKVEEYKVDLGDKFITDLTYRVDRNGDLVFSGFYSDKGTYSIKGTYFFRLNPDTREITNKNLKKFDFRFLTEYMSDNKREKVKKAARKDGNRPGPELYQYALDELILRSDGGAVLVAEQFYVEQRYDNNNPYYSPYGYGYGLYGYRSRFYNPYYNPYGYGNYRDNTYYYNYNDIIIVNIKPTGEIEWTARIPKQQITSNDGGYFSSYAMSIVRDKFYFVFNDNPKNFASDKKNNKWYSYTGRNSIITLAEVSKNGEVDIYPVFGEQAASITTRPKICKQIGRNEMLIYGERGRKFRFGSLSFR